MLWPKTLIFTANTQVSSAASSQVLERLLTGSEEHFGFIRKAGGGISTQSSKADFPVKSGFRPLFGLPLLWRFEQFGWYQAAIREGLKQVTRSKWEVILACYPNLAFTVAAARVAQITGLPLIVYLMDLFIESRVNPVDRIWARVSEKRVMTQASSVICLTEGLQEYYSRKYNIRPVLIQHCVTESEISEALENKPHLEVKSPITVTYAGGVYQARLDSLIAVMQAIEKLNNQGCPAELLILGKNDPAQLATWGLDGQFVKFQYIEDRQEFMNQLRDSDILLSTIAYKSAYPLQDQTCFPTKTYDYFLAGKPVLVVAPERTDYVSFMSKNNCSFIATTLDPKVLADSILTLASDDSIRKQFVDSGNKILNRNTQKNLQTVLYSVLMNSMKISHRF